MRRLALLAVCWLLVGAAAAEPLVPLAVLPFGNLSEYRGHLMNRRAAATVAAEAPAGWSALDFGEVLQALEDLAIPEPVETADLQRLCARVSAAAAVTGVVRQVRVEGQNVEVTLLLEVTEPLSGEVVGRAQGVGKFTSREPLPVETRVESALLRAAQAAWKALGAPPAVVGWTTGPPTAGRLSLRLAEGVRLPPRAVVLLFPLEEDPAALPLAAAVVDENTGAAHRARLLGERRPVPAGAIALAIGRMP